MKRNIATLFILALLCACSGGKKNLDPFAALTNEVDSIKSVEETATTVDSLTVVEEEPDRDEGAFDDFIYNFTSDHAMQMRRINFPLPMVDGGIRSFINKKEWEHEDLFILQEYYTLLFNREEDMDLGDDLSVNSAYVEWLYPATKTQKQYFFGRKSGVWKLDSISVHPVSDAVTADFLEFYAKFAVDSLYQASHISQHLTFVTTDPDDDFAVIETSLDLNQWFAFAPTLPADKLSNICYGEVNNQVSNKRILQMKGMGNGLSNVFYFRMKRKGNWELYKFEDVGI